MLKRQLGSYWEMQFNGWYVPIPADMNEIAWIPRVALIAIAPIIVAELRNPPTTVPIYRKRLSTMLLLK
jgi:hypothetical protein